MLLVSKTCAFTLLNAQYLMLPWKLRSTILVAFYSLARIFGRMSNHSFPACTFFSSFFLFFFFTVEISLRTFIPLFMPGSVHSGSASWNDCGQMFPDRLLVSSFSLKFPHYTWTVTYWAHSDFVGSGMYTCIGLTCHLHFWQNDRGLLHATAVTREWNGHQIRVSTQS